FQVMFVFQNTPTGEAKAPGLVVDYIVAESGAAKLDLTLTLTEKADGGLSGSIEYNTDLYETATIRRMIGHFQTLLSGIIADPAARISELRLLSDEATQGLSPSDFPDAELSVREFENLLIELAE
ncbi:MAG: condensation domain-containing protein, partial [Blastocatellia bacterium]